jgi:hypothetical protein
MIFTTGAILIAIGWLIVNFFGGPNAMRWNHADTIGAVSFIVGVMMIATSLLTLAWRHLP